MLADLWLVLHGRDDEADAIDAIGAQLLLLSCIHFHSLQNILESGHEVAVVWGEGLVKKACDAA